MSRKFAIVSKQFFCKITQQGNNIITLWPFLLLQAREGGAYVWFKQKWYFLDIS